MEAFTPPRSDPHHSGTLSHHSGAVGVVATSCAGHRLQAWVMEEVEG